ncbi:orotidine-5'-phosphate decarboxylase [Alkalicoccobacillus murimartini]|uniref:Orotidine 5'-phosphate decarboxylase n=1 Tax=Alkalicoccobacillus murimartini TaxID=171685 RepID=A0ABT9YF14_9BACI|nr:orotidine-5'-phosphate decarboxylase [Alkalicoccobacillus murimartini]MDQ0206417.1 orotidine-5'-phosphate decarboxylase [Alkalicoccobacillus murimartini]
MQHPLIIALDFDSRVKRQHFLEGFGEEPLDLKIGMEGFYREGATVIEELKQKGHRIFLDLKLHDIPNTVHQAMKALANLEIDLVNVHAAGGQKMMSAAREGLEAGTKSGQNRPKLIGVTQLTSTDDQMLSNELLIQQPMDEVVAHYAQMTAQSGLDGIVCSALEVQKVHEVCGTDFLTVTPGIRMPEDDKGDQHRIVTPAQARQNGSWGIVVGRSITQANDPLTAYQKMKQEWERYA